MKERYFTKSKFSLSMECPTKLYYASKPNEYASTKSDDQFLKALAEGGFQVGQLAKCYYRDSNPIDLSDLSNDDAASKTSELLLRDEVVIFEAVIIHNNLFLRADILVKKNNHFRIIEVKSSSANPNDQPVFMKKRGGILSDWLPYIHDIAFQKLVLQNAFKNSTISAYLMLLDKTSTCPTDGLNQKFKISLDANGRTKIIVSKSLSDEDLSRKLLREFNVDDEINYVSNVEKYKDGMSFDQYVSYLANMHVNSEKVYPIPGKVCAKCEFNSPDSNTLNGFRECWIEACGFKNSDFEKQSILDVWYYTKKDELIRNGIYRPVQLNENDINPKPDNKAGWSRSERQWLQVQKAQNNDQTDCLDKDGLSFEVDKWVYPLHFIDFETAMPAIPLNKDAPPYQPIAFQFSHHVLHQNGKIEHVDQFINNEVGINPNINFVRTLMLSLNRDSGTIFRYHNAYSGRNEQHFQSESEQ